MQTAPLHRSSWLGLALAATLTATCPHALAQGVAPAAATPEQRDEAQDHFTRARELYTAGKFEEALAGFNASLDLVASPNTRLYAARCLRELGRLALAYAELDRTAEDAKSDPRYDKTRAAALEEQKELEAKIGFAEISITNATPATTLQVGGVDIPRERWTAPVPVSPGPTEIVVASPDRQPVRRTVDVAAGARQSVAIDADKDALPIAVAAPAAPPPEPEPGASSLRPYAYVAGGAALAGLATFTVFGLMAGSSHSDLESACGAGPCPAGREDDISAGRTQQTIANIGLVVFGIGAAAAVTLFVISSPKSASPSASAASARVRVVTRGASLALQGTF